VNRSVCHSVHHHCLHLLLHLLLLLLDWMFLKLPMRLLFRFPHKESTVQLLLVRVPVAGVVEVGAAVAVPAPIGLPGDQKVQ
jgi:hypothetical protein